MTNSNKADAEQASLYDRMGGDPFITLMVESYFDELAEDSKIRKFFQNVPMAALKVHQVKFFQVCFGPTTDQAAPDELMDYLLITHTRLFREHGMDETHFDHVAECLVQSLQTFQVEQALIDEAVALLGPLRPLFARGAQIARDEQAMTSEERASLPVATAHTWDDEDMAQVLPEYKVQVPDWLPDMLQQLQPLPKSATMKHKPKLVPRKEVVRAWTCNLTNALAGDGVVADTFLDMPYLQHHAYLVAFLQLAFQTEQYASDDLLLDTIRYPRGRNNSSLTRRQFGRLVRHFSHTCETLQLQSVLQQRAVGQLEALTNEFCDTPTRKMGPTTHTIHPSRKQHQAAVVEDGQSLAGLTIASSSISSSSNGSRSKSNRVGKGQDGHRVKSAKGKKRSVLQKLRLFVSGDQQSK